MRIFKNRFRILKKDRLFSLVNILGLSIGMFCFLITSLYVKDELTFDRWHINADRIYMSTLQMQREDGELFNVSPSNALTQALKEESPEVIQTANISRNNWVQYKSGEEWVRSKEFYYSTPTLFQVFDFSLKYGNADTALAGSSGVIISSEMAESLFQDENPMNQVISFKGIGELTVSGVLNPVPKNSHLQFDFIAPTSHPKSRYVDNLDDWEYGVGFSYFLLKEDYQLDNLNRDAGLLLERNGKQDLADNYDFLKFSDLYLNQKTGRYGNYKFGGQMKYVYIFTLIGVLILVVACFNYINLATSASIRTTKQMGIKKVIGASRYSLIASRMLETLFLAFFALVFAIISVELSLKSVNELIGKNLSFNLLQTPSLLALPAIALLLVMIISGIYPALTLSSFNLSSVLRGVLPKSNSGIFKKSLIVLQFTICSGLLVAALAIRGQADFLINIDKGYNQKNIMTMSLYQEGQKLNYDAVKNKLEGIPQIEIISASPFPVFPPPAPMVIETEGRKIPMTFYVGSADKNFNEMFQLEFLEGNDFSNIPDSELKKVAIINETAKKRLGLNPAIGMKLPNGKRVVGVVKDFFYSSAKQEIQPASIIYSPRNFNNIQVLYRAGNKTDVQGQIELALKDFGLESSPILQEVEGAFNGPNYYDAELTLKIIFNVLTAMVVLVAFLGLFALASFESSAREKEMGIRKVLGAGFLQLIKTLNRQFLWLIMTAFLLALPVTFYLLERWLEAFPYRLEGLTSFGLMSIVMITVMAAVILVIHSYFSIQKNPVDVLRNE